MNSLIRQINKSQLKDERAWQKDGPTKEKIEKLGERQRQNRPAKKENPGQFKKGNKYAIKPAEKNKKPTGPKKQVGGQVGIKRKGRLPSKMIINRAGKRQTVYYRPDKKTKSKYIKPEQLSMGEMMENYKESFRRMLFFDHDNMENWLRAKGAPDHAWGARMVEQLDKLADKYGFTVNNFDKQFNKIAYGEYKGLDEFMFEAQQIYGELYKMGDRHPIDFLNRIFDVTKQKLSMKGNNRKNLEDALQKMNIFPINKVANHNILKPPKGFSQARNIAAKNKPGNNDDEDNKNGDAAIPKKQDDKAKNGKAGTRDIQSVINDQKNLDKLNKFLKKKDKK